MKNENIIKEMINQAKILEENTISNMKYANSLSILINSNTHGKSNDKNLSQMIETIHQHLQGTNKLTDELLNDLLSKYN